MHQPGVHGGRDGEPSRATLQRGASDNNARLITLEDERQAGCLDCTRSPSSKPPKMVYSGGLGKGEYAKVTDHVYVGDGGGSWKREEIEIYYGWRLRKCSFFVIAMCLVVSVAGLSAVLLSHVAPSGDSPTKSASNPGGVSATPSSAGVGSYNCDANFDNWVTIWTARRKDWCCKNHGKGCPTTSQPLQFDCKAGRSSWETLWAEDKKDWCCGFSRGGCAPTHPSTTQEIYNCAAGIANWKAGWSDAKKKWCCIHFGRGCQVHESFDCAAGWDSWQTGWSQKKKVWCCHKKGKGCLVTTSSRVSTSSSSSSSTTEAPPVWECTKGSMSCDEEKRWCCKNKHIGCSEQCKNICVYKHWAATCSDRIMWAAKHQAPEHSKRCEWARDRIVEDCGSACSACPVEYSGCKEGDLYDCSDEDDKASWAEGKQAWCCLQKKKGCDDGSDKDKYTCDADQLKTWEPEEIAWCCTAKGLGCSGVKDLYDCKAGEANWRRGWSSAKAKYCCDTKGVGCDA